MFNLFILLVLLGFSFYMFVQARYDQIVLTKTKAEIAEAKEKKIKEQSQCPSYFADNDNECRYNKNSKKFTCQFNPKSMKDSGFFYNSPDVCCNNRCSELNKILDIVLQDGGGGDGGNGGDGGDGDGGDGGVQQVWCQQNNDTSCKLYNSPDGACPTDNLTGQTVPAFKSESECISFNKETVCKALDREKCLGTSNCVWSVPDGDAANASCVFGTGSGSYNATINNSVGYINGETTAIAGNTNPYFMVSTLENK